MRITYFGQSCFLAEVKGKNLLFDPFITANVLAKHININDIDADYIFLSHGHNDHVADAEAIARSTGASIVSNYEVVSWYQAKGIANGHPMNIGGKLNLDFGTVKCVNAIHSSAMPDGSYGGNPMGFVINSDEKNFYFSGDTALTMDMQLIPAFAKLDFCVLPIGDNFTMGAEDAVTAAKMIQCNTVIGVHYNTFDLIRIDEKLTRKMFESNGLTLLLPGIGESIDL